MNEEIKFHCSSCHLCCTHVGNSVKMAREMMKKGAVDLQTKMVAAFPYKTNEKGACENLTEEGCRVYETRPAVCRVDKSFELFAPKGMSREKYYEQNGKLCNTWQKKAGMDIKYLVTENYS